jgi:hypothetical protein
LNKLVERVELLTDKTFFVEEAGNDGPAILLGYFVVVIFVYVRQRLFVCVCILRGFIVSI